MGFKVVKNGEEILVRDTPENRQKARDQGLTAYDELLSPDGEIVHVNENISAKAIREKGYKIPEAAQAEKKAYEDILSQKQISPVESAIAGGLSSMTWGAGPAVAGATRAIQEGALMSSDPWQKIKTNVAAEGLLEQQRAEKNPLSYLGGSLLTGIAVPGVSVAKTAKTLPAIGKAALIGAGEAGTTSALTQLSDPFEKTAEERAKQAGEASLYGLGLGAVGGTLAKSPEIAKAAKETFPSVFKTGEIAANVFTKEGRTANSEMISELKDKVNLAREAFKQGAKTPEKGPSLEGAVGSIIPGVNEIKAGVGKVKEILTGIDSIKRTFQATKELDKFAEKIRAEEALKINSQVEDQFLKYLGKKSREQLSPEEIDGLQQFQSEARNTLNKFNTDELLVMKLDEEGISGLNDVQNWYVNQISAGTGGRIPREMLEEAVSISPQQRKAIKQFDPREFGLEAQPARVAAEEAISEGSRAVTAKLMKEAGKGFELTGKNYPETQRFLNKFQETLRVFGTYPKEQLPKGAIDAVSVANHWIQNGGGPRKWGLRQADFFDKKTTDFNRYMRFQHARQALDDYLKGLDRLTQDDVQIQDLRNSVDSLLKSMPEKVKADAVWSLKRTIEEEVFLENKEKGLNFTNLARMLSNSDTAVDFRNEFKMLQEWANDPVYPKKQRLLVQNFLNKFNKAAKTADQKRLLQAFEQKLGPSSSQISLSTEQLLAQKGVLGAESELTKRLRKPVESMQAVEGFLPNVKDLTGKEIGQTTIKEKLALQRTRNWFQNERIMGRSIAPDELKTKYDDFLKAIETPTPPPVKGPSSSSGPGSSLTSGPLPEKIKSALTNYLSSKGTSFLLNEAAKAAGSETGINVFEPYKEELKQYMVDQGIPETAANVAIKLLPDNPLELANMLPRFGNKMEMGDVIKFPKEKAKPKSKAQISSETKLKNDVLSKEFKDEMSKISLGVDRKLWPYKEYPKTPSKDHEINASTSRSLKMLEGGNQKDYESFVKEMEKGKAKQSVFDTFNPDTEEGQKELTKFRLFRQQAQAIDRLKGYESLKDEFKKGGKYESIKNRKNIIEQLDREIKRQKMYLNTGDTKGRYDAGWNIPENDIQAMEGFQPFIPPEMLKKYLEETKQVKKSKK